MSSQHFRVQLERASPYKLSICILISVFVKPRAKEAGESNEIWGPPLPLERNALNKLMSLVLSEMEQVDEAREKGLDEVLGAVRKVMSGKDADLVADFLESKLTKLQSPDDLVDLITMLKNLTVKPTLAESGSAASSSRATYIEPDSLFGVFIRRSLLDCNNSSFRGISCLYDQLKVYVQRSSGRTSIASHAHSAFGGTGIHVGGGRRSSSLGGFAEESSLSLDISAVGGPSLTTPPPFLAQHGASPDHLHLDPRLDTSGPSFDQSFSVDGMNLDRTGHDSTSDAHSRRVSRADLSICGPARGPGGALADATVLSVRQVQAHLQSLAFQLEKKGPSAWAPGELEDIVRSYFEIHPDLPRAHFLLHLRCLQERELLGSLEGLHRYFDYSTRKGGAAANPESARSVRAVLPYALLQLAALHIRFGHTEMARKALQETMRVAQDSGDHICVAYGLSWLYEHMISTAGTDVNRPLHGSEVYGVASTAAGAASVLRSCLSGASTEKLDKLATNSILSMAKDCAVAPIHTPASKGRMSPHSRPQLWQLLESAQIAAYDRALAVSVEQSKAGVLPDGSRYAQESTSAIEESTTGKNGDGVIGSAELAGEVSRSRLLVTAAAYSSFGAASAAEACARAVLEIHKSSPGSEINTHTGASSEELELAISVLVDKALRGEPEQKGRCVYGAALDQLFVMQEKPLVKATSPAQTFNTLALLHEWMTNRGELFSAAAIQDLLCGIAAPLGTSTSGGGGAGTQTPVLRAQARLLCCALMCARGRHGDAYKEACDTAADPILEGRHDMAKMRARAYLMAGEAWLEGAGESDPVGAFQPILSCLALCEAHSLQGLHSIAMLSLAKVHLLMSEHAPARVMLRGILSQILVQAPIKVQGDLWLSLGKCDVLGAPPRSETAQRDKPTHKHKQLTPAEQQRRKLLMQSVKHFEKAAGAFRQCHALVPLRETLYLLARVLHDLGQEKDASRAASSFSKVDKFISESVNRPSLGFAVGPKAALEYAAHTETTVPW